MENWVEWVGFLAGICTTGCYIPQVLLALKTRSLKDLSILMIVLLFIGVAAWAVYGALLGSSSMVIFNTLTTFLVGIVLWVKISSEYLPQKA
jgi:MtN3 and saliva related transmembrane protein